MELLSADQIAAASLDGWTHEGDQVSARFATESFERGTDLVVAISALAEQANHHPDVLLTYPQVEVTLTTHDAGGVTTRDVDLARKISHAAAERGIHPTS